MSQKQADLKRAYQLIKQGDKPSAQKILLPIVRADDRNVNAWLLLAMAAKNAEQRRHALETVLKHDPDNEKAQAMLKKTSAGTSAKPASKSARPQPSRPAAASKGGGIPRTWLIVGGLLVVVAVVALAAVFLLGGEGDPVDALDTPSVDAVNRGALPFDAAIRGDLLRDTADVYFIEGTAGQGLRFTISKLDENSELMEADLRFYQDTSAEPLVRSDWISEIEGAQIDVLLPEDGTYYLYVDSFFAGGEYALANRSLDTLRQTEDGDVVHDHGELATGATVSHVVQPNIDDLYQINLSEPRGIVMEISNQGSINVPELVVTNEAGTEVASGRLLPGTRNLRLPAFLPEAGTYTLRVSGGEANYNLSLQADDDISIVADTPYTARGAVRLRTPLFGGFISEKDLPHGYTLASTGNGANVIVNVLAEANFVDPAVAVYDPNGERVAENDDIDFMNDNAQVSFPLSIPGDYLVLVIIEDMFDEGTYQIIIEG
jgi:hypothetical protein